MGLCKLQILRLETNVSRLCRNFRFFARRWWAERAVAAGAFGPALYFQANRTTHFPVGRNRAPVVPIVNGLPVHCDDTVAPLEPQPVCRRAGKHIRDEFPGRKTQRPIRAPRPLSTTSNS